MRDYGKVYTLFWTSEDVLAMTEDERTLALYLLTCPHGNMLGCFRLPSAYASEDLKWTVERVSKGFSGLVAKGYIYRCERSFWVVILRYMKWNQFENPNVGKAAGKLFNSLQPPVEAKALLVNALREFSPTFPVPILDKFERDAKAFPKPFELSPETGAVAVAVATTRAGAEAGEGANTDVDRRGAPLDRDVIPTIFAYWQKMMHSPTSKLDTKRIDLIRKALKMGYEPRQLCEAILGCSRSAYHMGTDGQNTKKYNGLGLILRNAEYIDKFIDLASQKVVGPETLEQKNARIIAEFLADDTVQDDPNVIDMEES
jgi:hypothetical protein